MLEALASRDWSKHRKDLHNTNIDEAAAAADLCGTTHLQDGHKCLLPAQHDGPCQFEAKDRPPRTPPSSATSSS
jgi:hypothetical protein